MLRAHPLAASIAASIASSMASSIAATTLGVSALLSSAFLAGCATGTVAQHDAAHGWAVFGTLPPTTRDVNPEVTPESLGEWANTGTTVVLSGSVHAVCRTMGCWLEVAGDSGAVVMVMNKDHAFFIPRNAAGRDVHAVGQAITETHTVELLKHLAMDAGRTQAEIDAITEPQTRLIFIADAVVLPPGGLEKPAERLPAEPSATIDTSMTPAAAEASK
jgi:hypothetical protein